MKTTIRILAIGSLAALVGYAFEEMTTSSKSMDSRADVSKPYPQRVIDESNEVLVGRMKQQQAKIIRRLGISAPFDSEETTDPSTGIDSIQELYDSGYIIPATLEQVEAALAAAALTPEREDDLRAYDLKHRGSYRFFLNQ